MIVCGQLFSDEIIKRIQATIDTEPGISRVALSRRVCEWLGWRRKNGQWKEMSCRVALLKLHRRGVIRLGPLTHRVPGGGKKKELSEQIQTPEPIRCGLRELGGVELVKVGSADSRASRIWNGLMSRYHYLGSGPLCGAQMRYLIQSGRGQWLGGLAFSAAAWRVEARDRWIGWSEGARQKNLEQVVCNSRFLILPWVEVPYLASHVLSQSARRLRADWKGRYGWEPVLLETFVERGRFVGTCYRAANWKYVGKSRGRGRQDRAKSFPVGEKDVYVYPLKSQAREILCAGAPEPQKDCRGVEGSQDWAEQEFGEAELKDERLRRRLLMIARDVYDRPQASIPQACQSRAKTKAAYRFFEHSQSTMDRILKSHYEATLDRVSKEKVVLVVQDTTSLNYSTHPATEGLGPIGSKREGVVGLMVHDSMAFNLEGTPLGLLDVQCWARNPEDFQKRHLRYQLPIEEKESHKWLKSFQKVAQAHKRCPGTTLVSVGDREADIYELFQLALRGPGGAQLLVRAERDRLLAEGQGQLWEKMAREAVAGIQVVNVPRRGKRAARQARLEVRFGRVRLKPPKRKPQLGELSITAILAEEIDAPEGVEALRWMLLTTMEVHDLEEAAEKLTWYAGRWGIEVYHRTLKSGCKVEQRQLGSADRIEACLAIDMVVAWRIFHLTKLGRETPEVSCTVFFDEAEWKALYCYIRQDPTPPDKPPTLREATRMVGALGGFLGRKSDGEPGTKSLWLGLQRLDDITATWKFMALNFAPHLLIPPVSSNPGYG